MELGAGDVTGPITSEEAASECDLDAQADALQGPEIGESLTVAQVPKQFQAGNQCRSDRTPMQMKKQAQADAWV